MATRGRFLSNFPCFILLGGHKLFSVPMFRPNNNLNTEIWLVLLWNRLCYEVFRLLLGRNTLKSEVIYSFWGQNCHREGLQVAFCKSRSAHCGLILAMLWKQLTLPITYPLPNINSPFALVKGTTLNVLNFMNFSLPQKGSLAGSLQVHQKSISDKIWNVHVRHDLYTWDTHWHNILEEFNFPMLNPHWLVC